MNKLKGNISDVEVHHHLSLVTIHVNDVKLTSIILNEGDYSPMAGDETHVIFKETEVTLGLDEYLPVSQQNQISGYVKGLEKGKLLARVSIDSVCGPINAIVTANAIDQLRLRKGSKVKALIKTNELMLSE